LQDLGEDLNYNAYGDTEADLTIAPTALYRAIAPFTDPFEFVARSDVVHRIRARRHTDMERATALAPYRTCARGEVYVLPDAPWSRRVNGTFANHLAQCQPDRAHALLVPNPVGSYRVNIRAPVAAPTGASRLARAFATGGGREAAAGIDDLPAAKLDEFIERFAQAW
jgi:hypothetical protein